MENTNKKSSKLVMAIVVAVLMVSSGFVGALLNGSVSYNSGLNSGYLMALDDMGDLLTQVDADFEWIVLADGRYELSVSLPNGGGMVARGVVNVDLYLEHRDSDGNLLSSARGAGTLTTIGQDWIEQQMSGTINATERALYLGDSNSGDGPSDAWTQIPLEINANGLERAIGSYVSTGVGAWNVTKTKTATGTQSTQLWGIYWKGYADEQDNCLLASDSTPSQKNMENGDTLTETWQISVS